MTLFSEAYVTAIAAAAACDIQSVRNDDDSINCTISSRVLGKPRLEVQLPTSARNGMRSNLTSIPSLVAVAEGHAEQLRSPSPVSLARFSQAAALQKHEMQTCANVLATKLVAAVGSEDLQRRNDV